MKLWKKSIALLLLVGLTCSVSVRAAETAVVSYMDIAGDFAEPAIRELTARGVVGGKGNYHFAPDAPVTRGEALKMLYALSSNPQAAPEGVPHYNDVAPESWYAGYVFWAAQNHLLPEITLTQFLPEAAITREQFALALSNFCQKYGACAADGEQPVLFEDDDEISRSAGVGVYHMKQLGVMRGEGGNRFVPLGKLTRGEACVALARLIKLVGQAPPETVAVRVIDPKRPMVALTFDDGPNPKSTNRILDRLAEQGGKATFFMLGAAAKKNRATVLRAVREGHEIGNHSFSHPQLTKLTAAQIQSEIEQTNAVFREITGAAAVWVRPTYGAVNAKVKAAVGYPMLTWSVDTLDWKTKNPQKIHQAVLSSLRDGAVILMHDLHSTTADACDLLIPSIAEKGYQMVTVSELFAAKGKTAEPGVVYNGAR